MKRSNYFLYLHLRDSHITSFTETMRKHFVPLVLSLLLFACDKQMPEEIVRQDIIVPTGSVFDTGISFDAGQGQTRAIRFTATDNWKANVTDTKASTWLSV